MSKPFDATTKRLLELDPLGWLTCVGLPITGPVRAVDSDLSTITAEADTIIEVGEPPYYLAHIEIQSARDPSLTRRLLRYNVLLNYRHERPVRSVAVILRREADSPSLDGHHRVLLPEGSYYLDFRYSVVRVWKLDVEMILRSGMGTLPLAPLAKVNRKDVRSVIERMKARLDAEISSQEASLLWTATQVLMGLRYSNEFVETLLRGIQGMEESVTYQAIIGKGRSLGRVEGRVEGEQLILLHLGGKKFGGPSPDVRAKIESILDEATISTLADRLFDVSSWDELLAGL